MDASDPISIDLYCQANGNTLPPHLARCIISMQRGWRAGRDTANPQEGFLATEFAESEVQELYRERGAFFTIRKGGDVLGFALTTKIDKFIEQYDSAQGGQLSLSEPLDLSEYVYLYQIVIRKGEQQRGLGKRLIQQVQRHHTRPLLADILSSPIPNLGSSLFFGRLGFRRVGVLHLASYRDYGPLTSEVLISTGKESP